MTDTILKPPVAPPKFGGTMILALAAAALSVTTSTTFGERVDVQSARFVKAGQNNDRLALRLTKESDVYLSIQIDIKDDGSAQIVPAGTEQNGGAYFEAYLWCGHPHPKNPNPARAMTLAVPFIAQGTLGAMCAILDDQLKNPENVKALLEEGSLYSRKIGNDRVVHGIAIPYAAIQPEIFLLGHREGDEMSFVPTNNDRIRTICLSERPPFVRDERRQFNQRMDGRAANQAAVELWKQLVEKGMEKCSSRPTHASPAANRTAEEILAGRNNPQTAAAPQKSGQLLTVENI